MTYASEQGVLNGQWNAAEMAFQVECKRMTPTVLMRPALIADGNMWCLLYGDNLQVGVAGFGETPEQAAINFDSAWLNQRTPAAMFKSSKAKKCAYCETTEGLRVKSPGHGSIAPEYTCEACFTGTDTGPSFDDLKPAPLPSR